MPEEPNPRRVCKDEICSNFYANNREGRTWAYDEGWHIGRNGDSYCPHHIPDWVVRYRKRIKQIDF
jgi:hypothetical protein